MKFLIATYTGCPKKLTDNIFKPAVRFRTSEASKDRDCSLFFPESKLFSIKIIFGTYGIDDFIWRFFWQIFLTIFFDDFIDEFFLEDFYWPIIL